MKHYLALMGLALLLSACGGSGPGGAGDPELGGGSAGDEETDGDGGTIGGGDDDEVVEDDDSCSGSFICTEDVLAVSYNEDDDVLTIVGTPFDEEPREATYVRSTALDVPGFRGYTNDDDQLFNIYLAVYDQSDNGEIEVGATGIANYQDYGYNGTFIRVNDTASVPDNDLVQYRGRSAGHIAFIGSGRILQTFGEAIIRVDTTDGYAKGFIVNRRWRDSLPTRRNTGRLPNLVLNDTFYEGGTRFSGTTASYRGSEQLESGEYTGFFAGTGDVVGGRTTAEADVSEMRTAPGFTDPDGAYPVGDLVQRDQSVFIADREDHGPNTNPFLP